MSRIEKYLIQGEIEKAKGEAKSLLAEQHKAEWDKAKKAEYDSLFKTKEITETISYIDETTQTEATKEVISYDYVEDCISLNEWLKETRVISEAVEEVSHIEVIDGIETKVIDVEYVPEVTTLVRPYTPLTESELSLKVQQYLLSNKVYAEALKQEALKELNITTLANGLRFYTDDKSLLDLMIADRQAELLGATNENFTDWKTADGVKEVSIGDIRNAIATRLQNKAKIVGVAQ